MYARLIGAVIAVLFSILLITPFLAISAQDPSSCIEDSAQSIVAILQKYNVKVSVFIELIEPFSSRYTSGSDKELAIKELTDLVLDTYYHVDSFATCERYNDGCNTCSVTELFDLDECTERFCVREGTPMCEKYTG